MTGPQIDYAAAYRQLPIPVLSASEARTSIPPAISVTMPDGTEIRSQPRMVALQQRAWLRPTDEQS
jgi:hypothetical protein